MRRPTRWGITGLGTIAGVVAREFAHAPEIELLAVGSRSQARADAFAAEHAVARAYGSYRALIEDPDIDVVYVTTPHPQHHAIALAAIRAGKAVLVEKAFTATLAGTRQIVDEARRRGVFAMEAMWTRSQPAIVRARELVAEGAIGDVFSVQANIGGMEEFDPSKRLFAVELGGGALLDIGVYPVSFAQMILGAPQSVFAVGALEPNGVDAAATLLLGYEGGRSATLTASFHSPMPSVARILGSHGHIEVPPPFFHPTAIVLHRHGRPAERMELPPIGRGYAHELMEVDRCLRAGSTESPVMPLDDTTAVMAILDEAGTQLGLPWAEDPGVDV